MKKFFGTGLLLVSLLLVMAIQSGYSTPVVPDDDVGIVYSIADNTQMPIVNIAPSEQIQIARGVSVPDKGLINYDCIVFEDFTNYQCNIYYTISRIDRKLDVLIGFERTPDKYPFSGNLGTWQRSSTFA